MGKGIIPILTIATSGLAMNTHPLAIIEAADGLGLSGSDEFTYTTRITVPEEKREDFKRSIRELAVTPEAPADRKDVEQQSEITPEQAEAFITKMVELDWDVSFLVDCY